MSSGQEIIACCCNPPSGVPCDELTDCPTPAVLVSVGAFGWSYVCVDPKGGVGTIVIPAFDLLMLGPGVPLYQTPFTASVPCTIDVGMGPVATFMGVAGQISCCEIGGIAHFLLELSFLNGSDGATIKMIKESDPPCGVEGEYEVAPLSETGCIVAENPSFLTPCTVVDDFDLDFPTVTVSIPSAGACSGMNWNECPSTVEIDIPAWSWRTQCNEEPEDYWEEVTVDAATITLDRFGSGYVTATTFPTQKFTGTLTTPFFSAGFEENATVTLFCCDVPTYGALLVARIIVQNGEGGSCSVLVVRPAGGECNVVGSYAAFALYEPLPMICGGSYSGQTGMDTQECGDPDEGHASTVDPPTATVSLP